MLDPTWPPGILSASGSSRSCLTLLVVLDGIHRPWEETGPLNVPPFVRLPFAMRYQSNLRVKPLRTFYAVILTKSRKVLCSLGMLKL